MNFNRHSELEGLHAFLGASKYHWVNYSDEKIVDAYSKYRAQQRGTELHAFADNAIRLRIKLPKTKSALNMYVNDGIGYKMNTEQVLYYSPNCFGTVDAISFNKNLLRIHDLKTGVSPVSMIQLRIYVALFCLEYKVDPNSIDIELRIYQHGGFEVEIPEKEVILQIMEKIIMADKIIEESKKGDKYE